MMQRFLGGGVGLDSGMAKILKRGLILAAKKRIYIPTSRNCDGVIRKGCPAFFGRKNPAWRVFLPSPGQFKYRAGCLPRVKFFQQRDPIFGVEAIQAD
jgi:hypothetical protein